MGVPVFCGNGAGLVTVAVGVTVLVTVGVAVSNLTTVDVGKGVVVGSTVVRLQASGNKKTRPKINFCHKVIRAMIIVTLS